MRFRGFRRCCAMGGCAAVLIAAPVMFDAGHPGLQVESAVAKDKGGGDRGGGRGVGKGEGRGRPDGSDRSRGSSAETDARGPGRDRARGRSTEHGAGRALGDAEPAARLDADETRALIAGGWSTPAAGTFRNHGQRVSTMVALARELGYPASVGALQGSFGTPFETGVASIQVELDAARAAAAQDPTVQTEVARLEAALAAAIAELPTGKAESWATVDLDVTGDGVVDAADLAAARAGGATAAAAP